MLSSEKSVLSVQKIFEKPVYKFSLNIPDSP